ncbi:MULTISPECIES: sensor domain-containing diguanylate cyclase [unclassified Sphingomonas]|uniref:sensor domain-containing diguanylate cyclase n=1 Tax=unclassified Sphingomonas TaxID=196159 RepID=UPI0006F6E027|nr:MULTISPECIES: diguanylate cyclase [unclassified Sphingomonas]KQX26235.1 hypothetical protein ASD17_01925 [Sphingomonas sp. Root1294]KQY69304.1 hypothetical protein ASD39_03130 [Sphingomonas sp. Root50]KRB89562.1 hypothetical protein ASE22_18045 [Sphingomonas sp. Root720]
MAGGVGYFLLAYGTILLTGDGHDVAAIWPANALLLAVILSLPKARWLPCFAAAMTANLLANLLAFHAPPTALLYAANNMGEVLIAGWLVQRLKAHGDPLASVGSVVRFTLFAAAAPIVSAAAGAATAHYIHGQPFWAVYRIWYFADALGLLIFTPLFLGIVAGDLSRWIREMSPGGRFEAAGLLLLVALCGLFTFHTAGYPMLFILNAPILLATFRLGRFGTTIALIIATVIGMVCTMFGRGPIAAMIADKGEQALFVQFYLAILLLSTLPVSAELQARRTLARRLAESEAGLRLLASESADALVRLDDRGRCIQSSGATTMLLGVETRELVGQALATLVDPRDADAVGIAFAEAILRPGSVAYCEFRPHGRSEDWLEGTMRALVDQEGRAYGAIGAIRDITMRKEREVSLVLAASTDSLTGALNHAAFMEHLDRALARLASSHLALIMVDVDHFKQVNDGHGHLAGDQVLVELHDRLRALLRDHDRIGRLGGDELAILLDGTAEELALTIAEAIRVSVASQPVILPGGRPLDISISCGVAQAYPGMSREALMRRADDALYAAKGGGRDRVVISDA